MGELEKATKPIKDDEDIKLKRLAILDHILAMADDAYLVGHPEWHEIVKEARTAKAKEEGTA